MNSVIIFDGLQLVGIALAGFVGASIGILLAVLSLKKRIEAMRSGKCYKHTPGELIDVASVGARAKYRCAKGGEGFWK